MLLSGVTRCDGGPSHLPPGSTWLWLPIASRMLAAAEHKTFPSFAGPFNPRADASKCDPKLANPDELTQWLRDAIRAGHTGELWEGDFPRYTWCRRSGITYEGRLTNPELGEYKGYPLEPDENVEGLT